MKIKLLFLALVIAGMSSCNQHTCPTYSNSAIKYHHHQTHPHPQHHP